MSCLPAMLANGRSDERIARRGVFMRVFVVVLCYRVADLTIDCLRSLDPEMQRAPGFRVGLLENGTGGDSAERLRTAIHDNGWESWVDLTEVYPNRGFTGGNNLLIRPALESPLPPDYIILLNSDTIVKEHALDELVAFMDSHPEVGIAGSQMLWPDGTVRSSPFRFPGIATELDRGLRLGIVTKLLSPWGLEPPKPKVSSPVEWVSGASMILRRTMLEEIGLLDDGLYTYFDDIDICWRARKAGWQTWYVVESKVIHLGGSSTGVTAKAVDRRPTYWFQARRRCLLTMYGNVYTALVDATFIVANALFRVRRWIQRKPDPDPKHLLIDSIRHSVFCTGFERRNVENPAMKAASSTPAERTRDPKLTATGG
jgi:N-acetylglucosaminyl-diphospho-decaprenol L-rhamnosyltransferase